MIEPNSSGLSVAEQCPERVSKVSTSKAAKGQKIDSYLLRGLRVGRPNQVWDADVTHLPLRCGLLYLVVVMDWHTCRVRSGASRTR